MNNILIPQHLVCRMFKELIITQKSLTYQQIRGLHRLRVSRIFTSQKILPKDSLHSCKSQRLMLYMDLLHPSSTGSFIYLPDAQRALEKLCRVIDIELQAVGCQKLSMPCMMDGKLYKKSGRWETTGAEMIKFKDRHGQEYCLGPTHEEAITKMVASFGVSHKSLPLKYYQITRKFRDEIHPKNGLLRGREFDMKDLYTFDATVEDSKITYELICKAYCSIFERLKLDYIKAVADTGNIGGSMSHEYHIPADIGEDTVFFCKKSGTAYNKELEGTEIASSLLAKCTSDNLKCEFTEVKGIEVGHAFLLGTKYSSAFNASYFTKDRKKEILQMGCYGIGVSRLLAAAIEALSLDEEIRWPEIIAPYQLYIIPQKKGYKSDVTSALAERLYDTANDMPNLKGDILLDDRIDLGIGKRLLEAKRRGYPHVVVLGKGALEEEPKYEYIHVNSGTTNLYNLSELTGILQQINSA